MTEQLPFDYDLIQSNWKISPVPVFERLGGRLADVFAFTDRDTGRKFALRVCPEQRVDRKTIRNVYQFLRRIDSELIESGSNVRVLSPISTRTEDAFVKLESPSRIAELYPFISGCHPRVGDVDDLKVVARALATFHATGLKQTFLALLPDAESVSHNHAGLGNVERQAIEALETANRMGLRKPFARYYDYLEQTLKELEQLLPYIAVTCLHLDTGPANIIIRDDGETWFIDCGHTVRGRRTFEVFVTMYYFDRCASASVGDSLRYKRIDSTTWQTFRDEYARHAVPRWCDTDEHALELEYRLLIIQGMCYTITTKDRETARIELESYKPLWDRLIRKV